MTFAEVEAFESTCLEQSWGTSEELAATMVELLDAFRFQHAMTHAKNGRVPGKPIRVPRPGTASRPTVRPGDVFAAMARR